MLLNLFKKYRAFRERVKQDRKESVMKEIRSLIYVNERHGNIYIVCNGIAVFKAAPEETTQHVVNVIERIRKVSIEYKERK